MKAYRNAIINMLPRDSIRQLISGAFDELEKQRDVSNEDYRQAAIERDFYKGQFEQVQARIERLQGGITRAIIA